MMLIPYFILHFHRPGLATIIISDNSSHKMKIFCLSVSTIYRLL